MKSRSSTKSDPIYLVTEYGELLDIKPMRRSKTHKTGRRDFREVRMIGDNTDAKSLYKWMNQNHNAYFLFDPKAHYTNSRTLYLALKRLLNQRYYGYLSAKDKEKLDKKYGVDKEISEENVDEQITSLAEEKKLKRLQKRTEFARCQLPNELFNTNRMVKNKIKQYT